MPDVGEDSICPLFFHEGLQLSVGTHTDPDVNELAPAHAYSCRERICVLLPCPTLCTSPNPFHGHYALQACSLRAQIFRLTENFNLSLQG